MNTEERLHRAVGLADIFELLTAAFACPTEYTTAALGNGAFYGDWQSCWEDATGSPFNSKAAGFIVEPLRDEVDFHELRAEYSRLYLLPGNHVPIWPYESCFLFRAAGREGTPGLFRTQACRDVEKQMREAGVITSDARTVPADSMDKELGFLSFLYGKSAEVLADAFENNTTVPYPDEWEVRAKAFAQSHILNWQPDLMAQTQELSRLQTYRDLAQLAICAFALL